MSKKLSDLFVVYRPKEIKPEKVSKEIYLPEGVYNWQNFLDNIERVQKSKFGQETPETKVEVIEETPFVFDWNTVPIQEYNDLWGFQPETLSSDYPGEMEVIKDDNGQHMRLVTNPLEIDRVVKARKNPSYKLFKHKFDNYKKNHNSELSDKDWDILEAIAGIESEYRNIPNAYGSGAYGYFQIMPATAKDFYKGSFEDVKNNPDLQIEIAVKNYKYLQRRLRDSAQYLESSRLTPLQVMYGMWWRPGSLESYLKDGGDNFKSTDKNDIISILKKAS